MRIVLALAAAVVLSAEPNALERYLGLTEEQIEDVRLNYFKLQELEAPLYTRIFELQDEIEKELKADPLNPTAIDVRYAEHQMLFRKMNAERSKMLADNAALLTAAQRRKLSELAGVPKLLHFSDEAHVVGLLGDRCVNSPTPPGSDLALYLQLSPEQIGSLLERQRAAYATYPAAQKRVVDGAIAFDKAMAAEPLEPQTLGTRSAARITAQRELTGLYKKLRADNQAALNERQRQLLNALTEAERLIDVWQQATNSFLEFVPVPQFSVSYDRFLAMTRCDSQYSSSLQ